MSANYTLKVTLVWLSVFMSVSSLSTKGDLCLNNKALLVEETHDSIAAVIENDSLAAAITNDSHQKKSLEQVSRIKDLSWKTLVEDIIAFCVRC